MSTTIIFKSPYTEQTPKAPQACYDFWNSTDPIDSSLKVFQTHTPFIYVPKICLETMSVLGELEFAYRNTAAFRMVEKNESEKGCWVSKRIGALGRNQTVEEQKKCIEEINEKSGAGYDEMPSVISLAAIVFSQYAYTGEKHLGDKTGFEGTCSLSRCLETVQYKGDDKKHHLVIGNFTGELITVNTTHISGNEHVGIVLVKSITD